MSSAFSLERSANRQMTHPAKNSAMMMPTAMNKRRLRLRILRYSVTSGVEVSKTSSRWGGC
jgi:hypothetical protein